MNTKARKISVTGTCFAGVYAVASAVCVMLALNTDESNGWFVFLQFPIALQAAALPESALRMLENMSWPAAYLIFGLPTLVALYLFGAVLGAVGANIRTLCIHP